MTPDFQKIARKVVSVSAFLGDAEERIASALRDTHNAAIAAAAKRCADMAWKMFDDGRPSVEIVNALHNLASASGPRRLDAPSEER